MASLRQILSSLNNNSCTPSFTLYNPQKHSSICVTLEKLAKLSKSQLPNIKIREDKEFLQRVVVNIDLYKACKRLTNMPSTLQMLNKLKLLL